MGLNINKSMEELLAKDKTFWIELLRQYMTNSKSVVIRAVPSVEEQKRMAKEEATRVEEQRKRLGVNGLATKGNELAQAMATNEIPPPPEMLTMVPIPNVDNIDSLPSTIHERGKDIIGDASKMANLDLKRFPVHVTACNVDTEFGYVS